MLCFPRNAAIAGVPVTRLKAVLESVERHGLAEGAFGLRSASPSLCDTAIALEVAHGLGMIEPDGCGLSHLGMVMLGSTNAPRIRRADARAILAAFLEKVVAYNQHPDRPNDIAEVWVYGSYVGNAPDLGDIDLALKFARRPDWPLKVHIAHVASACERHFPDTAVHPRKRDERLMRHLLFGKARPRALSVLNGLETLVGMADPCSLVFAHDGGVVAEPVVLARHPLATTRSPDIRNRDHLPAAAELLAARLPLHPLVAGWVAQMRSTWTGPSPRTFRHSVAVRHIRELAYDPKAAQWRKIHIARNGSAPARLDLAGDLDGRRKVALVCEASAYAVERAIVEAADGSIAYQFAARRLPCKTRKFMPKLELSAFAGLQAYLMAVLAYGDMRLIAAMRPGVEPAVALEFDPGDDGETLRSVQRFLDLFGEFEPSA